MMEERTEKVPAVVEASRTSKAEWKRDVVSQMPFPGLVQALRGWKRSSTASPAASTLDPIYVSQAEQQRASALAPSLKGSWSPWNDLSDRHKGAGSKAA